MPTKHGPTEHGPTKHGQLDFEFEGFYQWFDVEQTRFNETVLAELSKLPKLKSGSSGIPIGYTYLGQFLTHEITRLARGDRTPGFFSVPPSELIQTRSPTLDLDSLYGAVTGFGDDIPNDGEKFIGQSVRRAASGLDYFFDLPRDPDGKALIGDARNDENYFVAQIHCQFLSLHNRLVELYAADLPEANALELAREELTLLYQQVIKNDFLRRVMSPRVYRNLFLSPLNSLLLNPTPGESVKIPIEFMGAVLRFGHSLIKDNYRINTAVREKDGELPTISLRKLFELTGDGESWRKIGDRENEVEWQFLFDMQKHYHAEFEPDAASPIDPHLADGLRLLPRIKQGSDNLALRNLLRGRELGVPAGQSVVELLQRNHGGYCKAMGLDLVKSDCLDPEKQIVFLRLAKRYELFRKMPLWTYILIEPACYPESRRKHTRLGVLGSIILGEVLRALLKTSRSSVLNLDPAMLSRSQFLKYMARRFPGRNIQWNSITMDDLIAFLHN